MKPPIVIIGIGELGSVFACGFLRLGHPVYPVTRATSLAAAAAAFPEPELVLVAVTEGDLSPLLETLPISGAAVSDCSRTSSCPTTGKVFPHLRSSPSGSRKSPARTPGSSFLPPSSVPGVACLRRL